MAELSVKLGALAPDCSLHCIILEIHRSWDLASLKIFSLIQYFTQLYWFELELANPHHSRTFTLSGIVHMALVGV